jgi:hypothetical protein
MMNFLVFLNPVFASAPPSMNEPLGNEAMSVFFSGLKVLAYGMTTVIGVLLLFYLLIKLIIKIFPEKE